MSDRDYMAQALALAVLGEGTTRPNPLVGCVIVNSGAIVGRGFHRTSGEPHAEVLALAEAGAAARGATLYVSLEPCAHQGRTGPCSDAIIRAGVRRVVAAVGDPNPLVDGRGLSALRAAGIEVTTGVASPAPISRPAMNSTSSSTSPLARNAPAVLPPPSTSTD